MAMCDKVQRGWVLPRLLATRLPVSIHDIQEGPPYGRMDLAESCSLLQGLEVAVGYDRIERVAGGSCHKSPAAPAPAQSVDGSSQRLVSRKPRQQIRRHRAAGALELAEDGVVRLHAHLRHYLGLWHAPARSAGAEADASTAFTLYNKANRAPVNPSMQEKYCLTSCVRLYPVPSLHAYARTQCTSARSVL